jgi:hypothetical protein
LLVGRQAESSSPNDSEWALVRIGILTGYRYTKRAAARMQAAREALMSQAADLPASTGYSRRIAMAPWPPLVILTVLEMIAGLSQLGR